MCKRFVVAVMSGLLVTVAGLGATTSHAAGGTPVDPDTLTPPPPPGAACYEAGQQVICDTTFEVHLLNEPAFELPCGLLYETIDDVRRGIRWYSDSLLTKRLVFQQAAGFWTLSPDGSGPRVLISSHANWRNVGFDPTTPEEEWPTTFHGMQFQIKDEAGTVIFQISGRESPDGFTGRGDFAEFESPELQERLCDALT